MPIARQNAALVGYKLMTDSSISKLKHSFRQITKHSLLVCQHPSLQHKAMLNENDAEIERLALAARLKEALSQPGMKTAVAEACAVTEQAVTGWITTGRIHKKHFPTLERITGYRLMWLLAGQMPKRQEDYLIAQRQTNHGIKEPAANVTDTLDSVIPSDIDPLQQRREQAKRMIDLLDADGLDAIQEEFEKIKRMRRRRRERAEGSKKAGQP